MREAFRRDLKGIGADPSKCGPHSLRFRGSDYVGLQCCQRYSVSATRSLEVMQATDIYVYDDLEPRLCFQIPLLCIWP